MALSSPLPAGPDVGQGPDRKGALRPRSCQRGRGAAKGCAVSTLAMVTSGRVKGQQCVCFLRELCHALECCQKPLASSSRKCDKEQGFCKGSLRRLLQGVLQDTFGGAITCSDPLPCTGLQVAKQESSSPGSLGFVFISVKHSGLLYLTDSPSHTPLSPHRASSYFWLSGDSETLIFRRNTIPCSLTPHPCCLSAPC